MGRLKKQTGQTGFEKNQHLRNVTLKFCVSPPENVALRRAAEASEFSTLAQYIREATLQPIGISENQERELLDREALYEIGRIGNSLNQIAKKCNQGNPIDGEMLATIYSFQRITRKLLKTIKD